MLKLLSLCSLIYMGLINFKSRSRVSPFQQKITNIIAYTIGYARSNYNCKDLAFEARQLP